MRYPMESDRMVWITFSPVLSDEGERTGVVALFKDMTEMEKLEKSRRDYVQNISHELRTPLTAMRGLLEPLADGMVSKEEDKQRYYKIMMREVLRLSRLITDMMQLTRLQAGTEYMEFVRVDIHEILEDVYINYNMEAAARNIRLVLDAKKLPNVVTDPDRIEQILVILLSNAMRYTPPGGTVTIRAENRERVHVSVIDEGSGIAEEDIPYLFDRFYTADKSRTEGHTGLGLSIAKQLIDKLGESITVESEKGKGACFTFTLKKYISNAIALGPAHDDWEAANRMDGQQNDLHGGEDAVYEVLHEQSQSGQTKKRVKSGSKKKSLQKQTNKGRKG
jgi:signal transduction histidine kinase